MNLNLTLIGQSLTFFLFAWFCMKYIWPLLKQAMRERQEAIEPAKMFCHISAYPLVCNQP